MTVNWWCKLLLRLPEVYRSRKKKLNYTFLEYSPWKSHCGWNTIHWNLVKMMPPVLWIQFTRKTPSWEEWTSTRKQFHEGKKLWYVMFLINIVCVRGTHQAAMPSIQHVIHIRGKRSENEVKCETHPKNVEFFSFIFLLETCRSFVSTGSLFDILIALWILFFCSLHFKNLRSHLE